MDHKLGTFGTLGIVVLNPKQFGKPMTMTAEEALAAGQLSISMPARVLRSMNPNPYDVRMEENSEETWNRKLQEAKLPEGASSPVGTVHGAGLYDRIKSDRRVLNPVRVFHSSGEGPPGLAGLIEEAQGDPSRPIIANGSHRVAVANALDPNMEVPIDNHVGGDWDSLKTAMFPEEKPR